MKNHKINNLADQLTKPRVARFENVGYLNINQISRFSDMLLWLLSDKKDKLYTMKLAIRIKTMYQRNGSFFTVLYLKEAHRLLMKALSGNPEVCKTFPRVATRRGLPLIVPGFLRLKIESQDTMAIRIVLSILTVYRIIKTLPVLKLETITKPFTGIYDRFPERELDYVLSNRCLRIFKLGIKQATKVLISVKAGPNFRTSVLGGTLDAIAFKENPSLMESLKVVADVTAPNIYTLLEEEQRNSEEWVKNIPDTLRDKYLTDLKLGKLSEKEEAAGKVRIFAITDVWTQSVLQPLANAIFDKLWNLPTDGTFDQLKPIKRLIDRGHTEYYSYDLSAATDRLPINFQIQCLSKLTNPLFAKHWGKLLVDRPWFFKNVPYYYSVGQPMGALSSWAMLALCHHILVQIAARRVGRRSFFSDYAVLGDDIVIADKAVALSYTQIVSDLGVDINMSKSLTSTQGVLEFAKRLFSNGQDISPIPPKLILLLTKTWKALPNVLRDMISRGLSITGLPLAGNKKLSKTVLNQVIGPFGLIPSVGLTPFLGANTLTEGELKVFTDVFINLINRHIVSWFYKNQNESQILIDKMGTLVWDRTLIRNGTLKQSDLSYDTPFFHKVMDQSINLTIEECTSQPELLTLPQDFKYEVDAITRFLADGMELLDSYSTRLVDITVKDDKKPSLSSFKTQFYRELDAELRKSGINFSHLTSESSQGWPPSN